MLKLVKFLDYDANYAYAPPKREAVINLDEIVAVIPLSREDTLRPTEDCVWVEFHNGTKLVVIGTPRDFVEIESK